MHAKGLNYESSASSSQKVLRCDIRLTEDCPQRTLGHVSSMIGYCSSKTGFGISPDFMTSLCITIEFETEFLQATNYFTVSKSRE
jgi:hypothetical protein